MLLAPITHRRPPWIRIAITVENSYINQSHLIPLDPPLSHSHESQPLLLESEIPSGIDAIDVRPIRDDRSILRRKSEFANF